MVQLATVINKSPEIKLNADKVKTYLTAVWQEAQDRKAKTKGSVSELNVIQQIILVELVLHKASKQEEPLTLNEIRNKYDLPAWLISKNCLALGEGYPRGNLPPTGGRGYVRSERLGRTNTLHLKPEGEAALAKLFNSVG